MDSKELIKKLQNTEVYPHCVDKIDVLETHISWIILTGKYAYKIKKPVNFDFLDFSSLEQRRHFCDEELRLNRRFAPNLYLEVVCITQHQDAIFISGEGKTIEYAVKMRQFNPSCTLDVLADQGLLDDDCARDIGRRLALFHQQIKAEPKLADIDEPQPGTPDGVWMPIAQNFNQITPLLIAVNDVEKLQTLHTWSSEQFDQLKPFIQSRFDRGFVCECHGDLHLGNMVQLENDKQLSKKVVFFDCIEFNPRFRRIDTMCELAFTAMDLDARGLSQEANIMLNTYLEHSGDYSGLMLINFYKVYFAIVRAKVALLQVADTDPNVIKHHANYSTFLKYLDLTLTYTRPPSPFVTITYGFSGSGKSTVAAAIAGASGAIRIRSDVERKRLFGLAPTQSSGGSIYTREASKQTFTQLHTLVETITKAGFSCIVDATFLHKNLRKRFQQQAVKLKLPFHILDCQAPEAELIKRLKAREQSANDASEATSQIMLQQQQNYEQLSPDEQRYAVPIDTTQTLQTASIVQKLSSMYQSTT